MKTETALMAFVVLVNWILAIFIVLMMHDMIKDKDIRIRNLEKRILNEEKLGEVCSAWWFGPNNKLEVKRKICGNK